MMSFKYIKKINQTKLQNDHTYQEINIEIPTCTKFAH